MHYLIESGALAEFPPPEGRHARHQANPARWIYRTSPRTPSSTRRRRPLVRRRLALHVCNRCHPGDRCDTGRRVPRTHRRRNQRRVRRGKPASHAPGRHGRAARDPCRERPTKSFDDAPRRARPIERFSKWRPKGGPISSSSASRAQPARSRLFRIDDQSGHAARHLPGPHCTTLTTLKQQPAPAENRRRSGTPRREPSCLATVAAPPWIAAPGREDIRVNTERPDLLGDLAKPAGRNGRE